jgi:hypothetical protein
LALSYARLRRARRAAAGALGVIVLVCAPASAAGPAREHGNRGEARAMRAQAQLVGIGNERATMFASSLWRRLHTRIARYIAPYDAVTHPYSLDRARAWIHAAERQHQQILVAFYHSEYTPTRLPSVAVFKRDVQRFVELFPHVRQYQPWDEANRGTLEGAFTSPSASLAARYYQALLRVCRGCEIVGLDVLDQANPAPTLRYIAEFKREIYRLKTIMPRLWGLHDYADVNHRQSWRTREIDRSFGGTVWLTETGGIVKFGAAFANDDGSGLRRAANVLRYTFALAYALRGQVRRVYIYDWTGGTPRTRFDAGLVDARGRPRPGYAVVCRHLAGADVRCPE